MNRELKTCPFCGGSAIVIANLHRHDEKSYFVKCNNKDCHIIPETYWCDEMTDAIEMWNRREENGKSIHSTTQKDDEKPKV